ncbi:MAG TPA: hypothetical protein VHD37_01555, partial [Candidatus Paceibacterota bacterium]|nr:hypothetical protein [Candidatus Paceibacterota bacterium]
MLVAMGAATALVEAARPLSCTITPPFTATTPAVLTCDRPIAIDRDANTGGDLEYFGSDTDPSHFTIEAADTIIYDAISASQYVISPIQKWSGIDRVRFAATLTGLIPHTRIVDLAMPPPAPVAFFTESDKKGGTAIRRVTLEDGKLRVDAVTAGDNLSDVVFDGKYSLSYLKPEQANAGRAVAIFDTLSNTERIFRHALLGKAFTAFAPGGLGSDYAWIEQKPGSSADAFVDNGA